MVEFELEVENHATDDNLKGILNEKRVTSFFTFNYYHLLDDGLPSGLQKPSPKDINIEILQLRMI